MTYNVFSGTLNPTHFTSLHYVVFTATLHIWFHHNIKGPLHFISRLYVTDGERIWV